MAHHDDEHLGRSLRRAAILVLLFAIAELAVAVWTNGLALGFDALHNCFDCLLLGLNLAAYRWSKSESYNMLTCRIAPSVPALTSGLLIGSAIPVAYLSVPDLSHPRVSHPQIALAMALLSVVINYSAARFLHRHQHDDHNAHSAYIHLMGDLGVAALAALGYVGVLSGQTISDPLAALAGIALIVIVNIPVIVRTWRDPMEHRGEHDHPTGS